MDKLWKQIVLAVTLGVLVPQLVFSAGDMVAARREEPQPTQPQSLQTLPAETVPTESTVAVMYLPIVMEDGQVRIMELEEYIRGVVLAEMSASFEEDALKAQAVAARTYVLRRLTQRDKHSQGVICTESSCCQAFMTDEAYLATKGTQAEWDKIARAVETTAGQVLLYEGKFAETTYFACSGGRTEDALAVWGVQIPYLQSVDSGGETKGEAYNESLYFSASEFSALLGRKMSGTPQSWFGKTTYTDGGGVEFMVIGGVVYTGLQLRKLLDLNSTLFTLTADESGVYIETRGWGHRVGMSQYGADAMAMEGSTYEQILAYYYPGTVIDKISDLG